MTILCLIQNDLPTSLTLLSYDFKGFTVHSVITAMTDLGELLESSTSHMQGPGEGGIQGAKERDPGLGGPGLKLILSTHMIPTKEQNKN